MKKVAKAILLLVALLIALSAFTLTRNDVPWNSSPGFFKRLTIYVTQNIAETSDHALFPELITRTYNRPASDFLDELIPHLIFLGWEVQGVDRDNLTVSAVVSSQLIGFKDDVHIWLEPLSKKQTRLHIRSASRTGHADYAANLSHILKLYQEIKLSELDK